MSGLPNYSFGAAQILDENGNELSHLGLELLEIGYVRHHFEQHLVGFQNYFNNEFRNLPRLNFRVVSSWQFLQLWGLQAGAQPFKKIFKVRRKVSRTCDLLLNKDPVQLTQRRHLRVQGLGVGWLEVS